MKNTVRVLFVTLVLAATSATTAYAKTQTITTAPNPTIRIKIGTAADTNLFTANGKFVVENADGDRLFDLTKNDTVTVTYANGVYTAAANGVTVTSDTAIRVTTVKRKKTVEVTSFENRPAWDTSLNDNIFFGTVEVVYSDNSDAVLLVNDLGIERYVRGIAEAGNENDADYLQALLTAARTYAWFNVLHPTKHSAEPYILDNTANDQVYRGAGFTNRAPNIAAAQHATAKQVITYDGDVIIAPYFSQSDGRTRSWSEVWGGSYAWAVSVDDPGCEGNSVSGHGVGLSAAGARYFAETEGWTWQQILQYYYTGVEIETGY
jgi:peptidoglycan hydrolase-like amidase